MNGEQQTLGLAGLDEGMDEPAMDPELGPDVALLRGFALAEAAAILRAVDAVITASPLRKLLTPGGRRMSVAMTNCGRLGWTSDRRGYRYVQRDPAGDRPWPAMPAVLRDLAVRAALRAGFSGFTPDACLINRYDPGARMSLHQDRDERDLGAPVVSLSLGLPATFLLGGAERSDATVRLPLRHGDVLVWGGRSRLRFHGVLPLKAGHHPIVGDHRLNLTFRSAG
jgi:alkylated DNA repair protein (DNA oxidative demethylase)